MQTISACMIVQNVEKTLAIALESLGNVYDELIIVDGGSTDKTCEIAANYGARIIRSQWSGNHSHQRNVYLREIKTDWVFVIDADEFIDRKTKEFLQFVQQQGNLLENDNFWIPRKWISPFSLESYISALPHTPDFQCRLFKYNKDISYVGQIHELIHGFKSSGQGKEELSIYHLDLFINSEEKRRAKVRRYMKYNPLDGALHYYLPPLNSLHLKAWDAKSLICQVQNILERLKRSQIESSPLNQIILPEIKDDEFYTALKQVAREEDIQTVLEIGSSSGGGSTEAFVTGLRENPNQPTLFCMEVSKPRFAELQNRYSDCGFVKCYNLSSVSLEQFTEENEVVKFYSTKHTDLNYYTLDTVLAWLHQDREYVKNSGVSGDGIKKIKKQNNIDFFDAVLIDGSEFTGVAEFEEVYGAKIIILDDINTLKNYSNYQKLIADTNYVLVSQNPSLRHGYAIFKKNLTISNTIDRIGEGISQELPIHFVTIVLNGEPFIRYHIEAFKQLPFKWHWHIVEGVADLKHDTAWSLQLGGSVTDQIHNKGRSIDGTSEYIDKIARIYPENVTVYRKPEGVFWDGKREMVNEPLISSIREECLLWQVDADELWTVEQICNARQMFLDNPEKTAAFYWCWYFVGENLVISSRNCYAQNPQQEWLRTWRFKPGAVWAAHEPPRLVEPLPNGEWRDVASVNPWLHEETEERGLVFQHFAYVIPEQLRFKEQYYGYTNALLQWTALQQQTKFPALLRQYLGWVQDGTTVDTAESCGVFPIAQKAFNSTRWQFVEPDLSQSRILTTKTQSPTIIIDGVFFQLFRTGIARVWRSLLEEWGQGDLGKHIVVVDRAGTAPKIPGIRYRNVPRYDSESTIGDREMLQQLCDEEGADLFISTYYTTPLLTPSVFMSYDMVPEVMEWDLNRSLWQHKHHAIRSASGLIAISENTANDLVRFFPEISRDAVKIAYCGVDKIFAPANSQEINDFKHKYRISKPYFLVVGLRSGYKNAMLFFQSFAKLQNPDSFAIVCVGGGEELEDEFVPYVSSKNIYLLSHIEDSELRLAYAGALALVYPSKYEGFGLPILEAMACGCPAITCPVSSIPEVAGDAALYVNDDVDEMAIALVNIQKPEVREALIAAGIEQAKKFSWSKMAKTVSEVLIEVFQETKNMSVIQENLKKSLPERDYISPNFAIVKPDECFPNMIVGDPNLQPWAYLRREVPHNWYVDKRHPTVGFLSRDEAHILYNTALKFKGKKALEIGCWLGWSACHLALAGVELEVVDPLLARPDFYESVSNSLQAAGVLDSIHLVAGYSPQAVEELAAQLQTKWSLIFIDGNHEAPGPLNDAIICEQLAAEDALIVFHDLAAPDVAQGLDYFKQKGWQTLVYQTMQIMGVAWRGNIEPVIHQPDPKVNWVLPAHLQSYTVSGMSNNQSLDREVTVRKVHEMMQQAGALINNNKPVEAMRLAEQAASLNINVPGMHYLRCVCLNNVGRHKEALAAAKAELAIDPTHRQAQEQVESLTKAILRSPIKIPTQQRSWNTTLARENMLSIQNASMNYSYRGVPMLKNPFDFAVYPLLVWNLKPRTIIEIGSKDGGSALWFGDMLNNFGIDGHIYSIDIVEVTSVQHPRVTYMEGNGRALQEILTPDFIDSLPRPLLVIEDADHTYETSKHVLEFFHPYLKREEYIVIEDGIISDLVQDASYNIGPHKALKEFLSEHEEEYEIDSSYCDYFGYNMTWCTNGFLKKVKESSPIGEPFLNKLFHYVEEYKPVSQVDSSVDLRRDRQKFAELIQKGKECFVKGEIETAIATFTQALEVHHSSLIPHNYLTSLYWQVGDVQKSLQHHIQAQFSNIAFDNTLTDEFKEILSVIRPYTLLSEARLFSLYSLARQICLDDISGNFVECGSYKGGSAALLAVVIKRYSLRPRVVYAFDTFEGMPEPTEADRHNGIPANLTDWGAGTLKAPLSDNLDVICQSLDVADIVRPVKGLFAHTLPESKSAIGSIALLHADGDWYESTMDIFNNIYDRVVPSGFIQIDDYGHWDGCKQAIHEFERSCGQSFALRAIDYTGVWFQKEDSVHQDCNHWRTFWHLAQASEKMGNIELAKKAAQAVLKIVPKLVKAENLLNRDRSQLKLVVSPEVSLSPELDDFLNNLRLREINIILFPDWQQPEESLCLQLEGIITILFAQKEPSKITALLDTSNISEEDANLVLSSVIMSILMEQDLDEIDIPEVFLLGSLTKMQWKALLPCINYRVVLENENQQAVAGAGAASLPTLKAANLSI